MRKRMLAIVMCTCLVTGLIGCDSKETVDGGNQSLENVTVDTDENQEELADGALPTEFPVETPPADMQIMETVNLMDGIETVSLAWEDIMPGNLITGFGVPLFQNALKEAETGENVLVSPMSAWLALCMAEAGAVGDTKMQMQNVLGISGENHLAYLWDYTNNRSESEGAKLHLANGIWYKNVPSLEVKEAFLQYNKTMFDATAYKAPFTEETMNEINQWVSENTDGMVPEILKEIKEEDVLYLVNALSFDAEWQNIYMQHDIWNDIFTTEGGEEQLVPMMHSEEKLYLEDVNATGFMKYYKGNDYAFVALLPKEGMTVAEYAEGLTAERLADLLNNKNSGMVEVTMPKFSVEFGCNMNDCLMQMGMTDAFHEDNADFSEMAVSTIGNIYISEVNQKCFLAVDERGTKAGAATAVAMANKMMAIDKKVVNLNRPFVYLIIDCRHNEPLFMGTLMQVEQ